MAWLALLTSAVACGEGPETKTADATGSSASALQEVASREMPEVRPAPIPGSVVTCDRTIRAEVVALDQVYTYNRFGSYNPVGMMYALKRDVVALDTSKERGPGNVRLRSDKRPRPLTLRANVGDCLQIEFTNWLAPTRAAIPSPAQSQPPSSGTVMRKLLPTWLQTSTWDPIASMLSGNAVGGTWFNPGNEAGFDSTHKNDSPFTRRASVHVQGLQYLSINDDGAWVGTNPSSLVDPGGKATYTFYAGHEGAFFMHSMGASFGGQGDGGSTVQGLFAAVNVEPAGSSWYRSKVSAKTLDAARVRGISGQVVDNPDGTPQIDYEARDAKGVPLLNILDTEKGRNEIVHGDLEAIITGYTKTSVGTYTSVDQHHFREITTLYHDEIKAVQAFDELEWNPTFHSVRDGFGVNYGVAGLGAELLANRAKIGPTKDCGECLYEEFFLESWANGDPALNVEKDSSGKAVRALYPDDPSNVHHSYLGDPVRIRNIHAGPAETHVFHLHAHQWKLSPGEERSNYLDSQTIGPGSAFTYDINYGGSGNRNLTPGDSIHHCHLYPHFAQGMWALWRVHDVFEAGTSDRRLPDGEIAGGTPNPAVIPIPERGMPPMPTYAATYVKVNGQLVERPAFPGYPFYIAANAGHRPPQPPKDLAVDGGLPRHLITQAIGPSTYGLPGKRFYVDHHALDAKLLPQLGTPLEKNAMSFHGGGFPQAVAGVNRPGYPLLIDRVAAYPAYTALGAQKAFYVNGRGPIEGAPYADPCPKGVPERNYFAAYVQLNLVNVNREGWHDPQARIMVLEGDVADTLSGKRPAEPFFFRARANECINFHATNLVPKELQADDFQIFTPTDIIGQHIHLVKFDVTSSDGAGNGWNYEDGTFSFQEVIHRIDLINTAGGAFKADGSVQPGGPRQLLQAQTHPRLGVLGAQTTVQRWWADPIEDANGKDRPLETVFTHDHFGPSSHQQHGLYGGLIVEERGSSWRDPQSGVYFGTRDDGGPTSWRADVITKNQAESFREFAIAFADYALLYDPCGKPVNPPNYKEKALPWAVGFEDVPMPEAVSAADPGGMLINYRNEPIPLRIGQRSSECGTLTQRTGKHGDMANVFRSDVHGDPFTPLMRGYEGDRIKIRLIQGAQEEQHSFTLHGHKWLREPYDPDSGYFNAQAVGISEHFEFFLTNGLPPIGGAYATADYMYQSAANGDLWNGMWGIMRTYRHKQTGTKTLGDLALEAAANANLDAAAISGREQTPEFGPVPLLELPSGAGIGSVPLTDPLIQESEEVDSDGKVAGSRTIEYAAEYLEEMKDLDTSGLVEEAEGKVFKKWTARVDSCPKGSVVRLYKVSAIDALNWLPGGTLVYNGNFQIHDPDAILFAKDEYLSDLKVGKRQPEPLILRARAGECVQVELTNRLPQVLKKTPQWAHHAAITPDFNVNQVKPSNHVSLHPQLVHYDVNMDDGANVGLNAVQTVPPGARRVYRWFTGDFRSSATSPRSGIATPVEFGIVNLRNMADVVNHGMHGGIGALVIEPPGADWTEDTGTDAQARVSYSDGESRKMTFRELVLLFQDGLGLHSKLPKFQDDSGLSSASPTALRNLNGIDDSQDTGMKAFNYRTEPLWGRLNLPPQTDLNVLNDQELSGILSNAAYYPPATPLLTALAGERLRLRVGHPSGHSRQHAFALHGAQWYANAWARGAQSLRMGPNPDSFIIGTQGGMSVMQSWNFIQEGGAGGMSQVKGSYLYRDMASFQWSGGGLWGVLQVQ